MTPASSDVQLTSVDVTKHAAKGPLSAEELRRLDAYWRASNYLSVGQIYLLDNPLLKEPQKREHIKPRLLGHWGTSPGLNDLDRFHLVEDVIDRLPQLGACAAYFKQAIHDKLIEHKEYIARFGDDMPEISGWRWGLKGRAAPAATSMAADNA
jgi:phosphoketolase